MLPCWIISYNVLERQFKAVACENERLMVKGSKVDGRGVKGQTQLQD